MPLSDKQQLTLERYLDYYRNLRRESLEDLRQLVSEDVRFCDPFNDVIGADAYIAVLRKALTDTVEPRFEIVRALPGDSEAALLWNFTFSTKASRRKRREIEGMSAVRFNGSGEVCSHIDYWDASVVYEMVPLLGPILRAIRRRVGASVE